MHLIGVLFQHLKTGRRPSGICGAALFISAHIHGFECTKTDVVKLAGFAFRVLKSKISPVFIRAYSRFLMWFAI